MLLFAVHATAAESESEIVQTLASCLLENAPELWESVSVSYSREGTDVEGRKQVSVKHNVTIGSQTTKLEPCRPLVPAMLVEKLNRTLPDNSQQWKQVTITIFRTGKFKVDWIQP